MTLCVLLWAHDGAERALIEYEDRVLPLVACHGGNVLQRARSSGTGGDPLEIHLLEFPSQSALDSYMTDERRTSLAADRDSAIARAEVFPVAIL